MNGSKADETKLHASPAVRGIVENQLSNRAKIRSSGIRTKRGVNNTGASKPGPLIA
jgi:hypothetical protein